MDKMVAWIIGLALIFVGAMIADHFIERELDKEYGGEEDL